MGGLTPKPGRGHTLAFGASAPTGVAVTEAACGTAQASEGTSGAHALDASQQPLSPAPAGPAVAVTPVSQDPSRDSALFGAKAPCSGITPEQGARLGAYCAEKDYLADNGWDVRFRIELRGEELGPVITAEIEEPCDALAVAGSSRSASRYTVWTLGDRTRQARREVDRAAAVYFERTGRALSWDTPLWMTHPLWLVIYAAWRDNWDGRMPPGWPFQGVGQAS